LQRSKRKKGPGAGRRPLKWPPKGLKRILTPGSAGHRTRGREIEGGNKSQLTEKKENSGRKKADLSKKTRMEGRKNYIHLHHSPKSKATVAENNSRPRKKGVKKEKIPEKGGTKLVERTGGGQHRTWSRENWKKALKHRRSLTNTRHTFGRNI